MLFDCETRLIKCFVVFHWNTILTSSMKRIHDRMVTPTWSTEGSLYPPNCVQTAECKAPAKRSQHANAPNRNIVAWAQHVSYVCSSCCDVLRHVGCCWLNLSLKMVKFVPTTQNTVAETHATCCAQRWMLRYVGKLRSFCRGLTQFLIPLDY